MNSKVYDGNSGRFQKHFNKPNLKAYRDANHSLVEDDSTFGDSGYTSIHHHTLNHLDPKHATLTTMQTIDESVEAEDALLSPSALKLGNIPKPEIITPTTANIQKIMSLTLNTPTQTDEATAEAGATALMEASPLKHAAELFELKTPPELIISSNEIRTVNSTPRKTRVLSRKRTLIEETADDAENNGKRARINKEEPGVCRLPFSPIHNRRHLIERSTSDNSLLTRCSTPKEATIRRRFFAETKSTAVENSSPSPPEKSPPVMKPSLRKYQSFSPGKLKMQQRYKTDSFHPYGGGVVKKSKDLQGTSRQSPRLQKMNNIPEEVDEIPSPEIIRHAAPRVGANASIILEEAAGFDSFDFGHVVGKSISPIKPHLEQLLRAKILSESPDMNETLELSTSFSRSTLFQADVSASVSVQMSPTRNVAHHEFKKMHSVSPTKPFRYTFRDLPKTPSKNERTRWREPHFEPPTPVKRTVFFDGRRHLDIICGLQTKSSAPKIIEKIFKQLSDEDLLSAYGVSTMWKKAIDESKDLKKRRVDYIKHNKKPNKENITLKSPDEFKLQYPRQPFAPHNYDTRSAARANATLNQSPPVSPNKSRFRDNQKIIRKLSPRCMTTCPRCAKPSPIITQKDRDQIIKIGRSTRSSAKKAELRKTVSDTSALRRPNEDSFIFPLESSSSDTSGSGGSANSSKIRRTLFPNTSSRKTDKRSSNSIETSSMCSSNRSSSLSVYSYSIDGSPQMSTHLDGSYIEEYGLCSGKSCGFKFCVKCLAEYHPGTTCRNSMELYSPGREEDSIQNRSNKVGSRQSRRTLRRL